MGLCGSLKLRRRIMVRQVELKAADTCSFNEKAVD